MKKQALVGGVTLLVIIGAVVFYMVSAPQTAQAPTHLASASAVAALPPGKYVEAAQYYDIAANYATSTPLSGSANTAAVTAMRQFVADTIAQFKHDGNFANLTSHDVQTMGLDSSHKEKLQINYLIGSSVHTVSYIYTTYLDTLGAHGNLFFKTFTFNTTTGQELSIDDVFIPGSGYLDTLSQIARKELPKNIASTLISEQMLDQGTTPDEKNFANFFFDNKDFVVVFAPYAVAPYAAGPQTLRFPLTDIANILKPEYR